MSATDLMSPKMTSQQLRKIKKPIIEKRRRERINESLNQLKTLVLDAMNKDESQYNKMEKADILEMTVKHLKSLQTRLSKGLESSQASTVNRYRTGYSQCTQEVNRYLQSVPNIQPHVQDHLNHHLEKCARKLEQSGGGVSDDNEAEGRLVNSMRVHEAQTLVLASGSPPPSLQVGNIVPVLISANEGLGPMSAVRVQTSPLPGSVIPLYTHRTLPPCSSPLSTSSCSSTDSRTFYQQEQRMRSPPSPTYSQHSAPSSPLTTDSYPYPRSCDTPIKSVSMTTIHSGCSEYAKELHKYSREHLLTSPTGSDVWRPW